MKNLDRLASELTTQSDRIMARWREQVGVFASARGFDVPTLNDHMPLWIAELASTLRAACAPAPPEAAGDPTPLAHGLQRYEDGFDIEEVVAEYTVLRDCVYELSERLELEIRGKARQVVDKAFDDAIAGAVKAFAESQAREVQHRRAEHLAFIAHDLRTPLAAITFSAHLLEQRLPGAGPDASRLLKTLGRNAKQLDALVNSVLKENVQLLTELGVKLERRAIDLWPLVELLVQDLHALAEKAGTRIVNLVPDELQVHADAELLRRVFQNLVGNAIAYCPGGEVVVGARQGGPGAPVECWVTDNGAGIAPERLEHVFDALETDPNGRGVGLGLAIVKTFVEAHEGVVTVESALGKGSTFRFTLSRAVAAVDAPAQETARFVAPA